MEEEIWKDVSGYEGLYQISNKGRIKSFINNKGICREKILKLVLKKTGYLQITLHKNKQQKVFRVHKLVALAFLPNPNNLPFINHKDENKSNNCVDNLEWCDEKYNVNYGTCRQKISESQKGEKGYWYGKHPSEETRNKLSEIRKGKKMLLSHEERARRSERAKARKGNKNPNYGKHLSEETKRKMSESQKKRFLERNNNTETTNI